MIVPVQGVVQANVLILIAGRRCIENISVNLCAERDGFAENKCRAPTGKNPVQLGKRVAIDRGVESAEEQLDFRSVVSSSNDMKLGRTEPQEVTYIIIWSSMANGG